MATSFLRQVALNSEPPSRRELSIAILTIYAVLLAVLAGKAVEHFRGTNMETWAPSSQTDSRARYS
jgi:hypothetical protein